MADTRLSKSWHDAGCLQTKQASMIKSCFIPAGGTATHAAAQGRCHAHTVQYMACVVASAGAVPCTPQVCRYVQRVFECSQMLTLLQDCENRSGHVNWTVGQRGSWLPKASLIATGTALQVWLNTTASLWHPHMCASAKCLCWELHM